MTIPVNVFHSDLFDISFTNLPTIEDSSELDAISRFTKSIIIPDYNMTEINSLGPFGYQVRHIANKPNVDLSQIQVGMKLMENMYNYVKMLEMMRRIRYADNIPEDELFRKYNIKAVIVSIKDNQKRDIAALKFTQAWPLTLSSLGLEMGSSEEVLFTLNMSYEELIFETYDIGA